MLIHITTFNHIFQLQRSQPVKDTSTNVVLGSTPSESHFKTSRDEFFQNPPISAYETDIGQGAGTYT